MNRLKLIADKAIGRTVADIGCDHGLTGKYILESGRAEKVIATDISEGSLSKAAALAAKYGLNIECRLGDGLSVIKRGEADCIVISGMGGMEIIRILTAAGRVTVRLVLSPNRNAPELRRYLASSGYMITEDICTEDSGKFYDIICAKAGDMSLGDTEAMLGFFWKRGDADLIRRTLAEQRKLSSVEAQLPKEKAEQLEIIRAAAAFWERQGKQIALLQD